MNKVLVAAVLMVLSFSASAGRPVHGVGRTLEAAVTDTGYKAALMAVTNNRCISRLADPSSCKQIHGGQYWQCTAVVAKHAGSCGQLSAEQQALKGLLEQGIAATTKAYAETP